MACACNLIIDSCCDLPFEVVDREGVELINFPYIMEDGEHADDLYQTTTAHDFFQAMRDGAQPTTSQVPIPVYQDAFKRAIDSGVPTVCLVFSSGLSGSIFLITRYSRPPCPISTPASSMITKLFSRRAPPTPRTG